MAFTKKLTPADHVKIKEMAKQGHKLDVIAKALSTTVSRQRIKQLTQQYGIDSFAIRKDIVQKELNDKMFKKWGSQWANKEYRKSLIYQTMREKFNRKKTNAQKIGLEFSINFGELTFPTHCPILGLELDYFSDGRVENSVSFDRIDPNKGYVPGNVVIVSWRANRIKNNGSADEHQKIADFLYQF